MRNGTINLLVSALSVVMLPAQVQTGQISGSVINESKQGLSKAMVMINIRSTGGATFTPFSGVAVTGVDGSFVLTGVPAGTFDVCPQLPGSDLISVCTWQKAPSVTVTAGKAAVLPAITLKKGVHLPIRVNDAAGFLSAAQSSAGGSSLSVDIAGSTSPPIPAILMGKDATGQTHDALIPFDTAVRVVVFSKALALADSKGAAIDKTRGISIPVLVPSGTSPAQISISVSGVNP